MITKKLEGLHLQAQEYIVGEYNLECFLEETTDDGTELYKDAQDILEDYTLLHIENLGGSDGRCYFEYRDNVPLIMLNSVGVACWIFNILNIISK